MRERRESGGEQRKDPNASPGGGSGPDDNKAAAAKQERRRNPDKTTSPCGDLKSSTLSKRSLVGIKQSEECLAKLDKGTSAWNERAEVEGPGLGALCVGRSGWRGIGDSREGHH